MHCPSLRGVRVVVALSFCAALFCFVASLPSIAIRGPLAYRKALVADSTEAQETAPATTPPGPTTKQESATNLVHGEENDVAAVVPRRLRILYVDTNTKAGGTYRYYRDFFIPLQELHDVCLFAPTRQDEDPFYSKRCKCCGKPFDVIVLGFSMFNLKSDAHTIVTWLSKHKAEQLKVVAMFNKEYQKLDLKLDWVRSHSSQIRCLFTVHHSWREYTQATGVPFFRLPFAVEPHTFDLRKLNPYPGRYKYDLGFTGHIEPNLQPGNWRGRILAELKPRLEQAGIRVFHSALLPMKDYLNTMASTKIWLSTLSSGSIVNPRYFEVMASGTTLLICPRQSNGAYEGIGFEDGNNTIMFDSLDEMYERISALVHGGMNVEERRISIVREARNFVRERHTYQQRGKQMTEQVLRTLGPFAKA